MKTAINIIAIMVIIGSIVHYKEVFVLYEKSPEFGGLISFFMGLVFDGTQLFFVMNYRGIKSKVKAPLFIILLAFISFFHYEYYSNIIELWKRYIYAATFPFMILVCAFLLNHNGDSEEDYAPVADENKSPFEFLSSRPQESEKAEAESGAEAEAKSEKQKAKSKKRKAKPKSETGKQKAEREKQECPGCGRFYYNLNGHGYKKCIEKHKKEV